MTTVLRKIDAILVRVTALDRAARFYTQVLGLTPVWRDEQAQMIGCVFPESEAEVVLHTDPALPNPTPSFLVEDVGAFVADYRRQGYEVRTAPFAVRTGTCAVLADPDGNALTIIDLGNFGGQPRYD